MTIGLSDMKLENISWCNADLPKMYLKRLQETLETFHYWANSKGSRGEFIAEVVFVVSLLSTFQAYDSAFQKLLEVEDTRVYAMLHGTNYYNLTLEQYNKLQVKVNNCLRKAQQELFKNWGCILVQPSPTASFSGVYANPRTGLPGYTYHKLYLTNYLAILKRFVCARSQCRIDRHSCKSRRDTCNNLRHGCFINN